MTNIMAHGILYPSYALKEPKLNWSEYKLKMKYWIFLNECTSEKEKPTHLLLSLLDSYLDNLIHYGAFDEYNMRQ